MILLNEILIPEEDEIRWWLIEATPAEIEAMTGVAGPYQRGVSLAIRNRDNHD